MRGNDEQNGPSPRDKIALIASRDKIYLYGGFGPRKGATSPENNGAAAETVQIQGDAKESSTTNGSAHGIADTNQATENGNASGDARDQARGSEADEERALKVAMNAAQNQQVGAEFGYFDDFYCVDPSKCSHQGQLQFDSVYRFPLQVQGSGRWWNWNRRRAPVRKEMTRRKRFRPVWLLIPQVQWRIS